MIPQNNLCFLPGTIFVARGGGSEPEPLPPSVQGYVLVQDFTQPLGVAWENKGAGEVQGPASATDGDLAIYDGTSGKVLKDVGISASAVLFSSAAIAVGNLVASNSDPIRQMIDSGVAAVNVVQGPASAVDENFAAFDSTTGKLLEDSGFSSSSFLPTFVSGGGAATKGTFTLSSGGSGAIATTKAITGAIISTTVNALGTVSHAQALLVSINNGVGFTITSADGTDSSSGTWAILG